MQTQFEKGLRLTQHVLVRFFFYISNKRRMARRMSIHSHLKISGSSTKTLNQASPFRTQQAQAWLRNRGKTVSEKMENAREDKNEENTRRNLSSSPIGVQSKSQPTPMQAPSDGSKKYRHFRPNESNNVEKRVESEKMDTPERQAHT